jgi:hypothetical protein
MMFKESLEGKWETKFEFWLSMSCVATAEVLRKDKPIKEIHSEHPMSKAAGKQYDVSHGRYVFSFPVETTNYGLKNIVRF